MLVARRNVLKGGKWWVPVLLLVATAFPTTAQAASRQINFDEVTAPCVFSSQPEKLTTLYANIGVIFSGPAADHGGEILNQCGGFGVSGQSAPNFLAFSTELTSENVDGPETLQFSPAADSVAIKAGSNSAGTVTMTAFDGTAAVAESSRTLSSTLVPVSVAGSHITSVRVAFTSSSFVIDDVVWSSPPVAAGDSYSVAQGTTLAAGSPGVLSNDSDADGDPLSAELIAGVSHGTLALHPAGDFTYTPTPGFSGQDSFTYRAVGASVGSAPATVIISVAAPPTPATAPPTSCAAAIAAVRVAKGKVEKAKKALAGARSSGNHSKVEKAKKKLKKAKKKLKSAKAALC
jgi:hypothetical protein